MNVFITGATGFIGTAVVLELLDNGHTVTGLARSDDAAAKLEAAGAGVLRGTLNDPDVLSEGAKAADGVIHLAFIHDFQNFADSVATDSSAIETIGRALEGSDKPFVVAAGLAGIAPGKVATEDDAADADGIRKSESAALAFKDRGVRVSVLRLPPSVHGETDMHGFIPTLIGIARDKGSSGYPGDGENRWSAVHVLDAANLFRLALEKAEAGAILHAVGDDAITSRKIAEAITVGTDVPAKSIDTADVDNHFGWIGRFFSFDTPASAKLTREKYGWEPMHPGLLDDLSQTFYFDH